MHIIEFHMRINHQLFAANLSHDMLDIVGINNDNTIWIFAGKEIR